MAKERQARRDVDKKLELACLAILSGRCLGRRANDAPRDGAAGHRDGDDDILEGQWHAG